MCRKKILKKWAIGLVLFGLLSQMMPPLQAAQILADESIPAAPAGYIALTFDDGPSGRITRRLLDGLMERNAHATFFLCGYRLEQYPETATRIAAEGHEIGLHGYSHRCMKTMDAATVREELEKTQALVQEQAGVSATLLRPPGGCCGGSVEQVAGEYGLPIITWSVDPRDWANHTCTDITQCILKNVKDGDIVLLHDMWDASVDAALDVIDALSEKGFAFVTVSQLAALKGDPLNAGSVYQCFPCP